MGVLGSKQEAARSKDPVCGRMVIQSLAVGPEPSAEGEAEVWFCSLGCQALYQDRREGKAREAGEVEA